MTLSPRRFHRVKKEIFDVVKRAALAQGQGQGREGFHSRQPILHSKREVLKGGLTAYWASRYSQGEPGEKPRPRAG